MPLPLTTALERMLRAFISVTQLHASRGLAALVRAAVSVFTHMSFASRRTQLRAGFGFALSRHQGSRNWVAPGVSASHLRLRVVYRCGVAGSLVGSFAFRRHAI